MVERASICLRRLAGGSRSRIVGFGRFLANRRVTLERLIAGWGAAASGACAGRHVLAIQDTSDFNFATTAERRRGLGEIGKGGGRGVLLHAMLGLDAETGAVLGLVSGEIWTRAGRIETPRNERLLADKESRRWLSTAEAAKTVLGNAALVTEVSDRESDIYAKWALAPAAGFHVLTRSRGDRLIEGGKLSDLTLAAGGEADVELCARPGRLRRTARLAVRFGEAHLKRPANGIEKGLPRSVKVSVVEVSESNPPAGAEPVFWRLLTTHEVEGPAKAWQIVGWYRMRWAIEQFFRTLKQQGLRLEDSQLETADRLVKLTAVAAHAACIIMQLVQARDGASAQPAAIAFAATEIAAMRAMLPGLEGKTALQKNPHPPDSLAWAGWIIAKLGGWDGYPKSKPPGPITFRHGLAYFKAAAHGWSLQNV